MPPRLLLWFLLALRFARCVIVRSPHLTQDSQFPWRPGVYRLDKEIIVNPDVCGVQATAEPTAQDGSCTAGLVFEGGACRGMCCSVGSEFVVEEREAEAVSTCQQCLPGWYADRQQQLKVTPRYEPVDAVQLVTCTGIGGTFTLSQGGKTTAPIAYDASAVDVKAALVAAAILPNAGTVTFTGATSNGPAKTAACDALGSNNITLTFVGTATPKALATSDVTPLGSPPLTGGSIVHAQLAVGRAKSKGDELYTDEAPVCKRCPHGKYGTAHRANCTSCLSNEHTNQHTRLSRADCLVCPTGEYYAWKEGCFGCWPNYFCPNGHDRTLCPPGTRSEARQTKCSLIPRIGFDTVVEPAPSLATPCTTQQHRADLACREHGKFNKYQCEASTSNINQIRTNLTDDHDSRVEILDINCMWCPSFNDSGVIADRCLAKQYCKAAIGLSSCWNPSAASMARSPSTFALALGVTLASAFALVHQI